MWTCYEEEIGANKLATLLLSCGDIYSGRCMYYILSRHYKTLLNTKIIIQWAGQPSWGVQRLHPQERVTATHLPLAYQEKTMLSCARWACAMRFRSLCVGYSLLSINVYTHARTNNCHAHTNTHTLSHIHTHTHTHVLSHTHTRSHTLSFSLTHVELSSRTIMSVYACISLSVRIFLRMCVCVCMRVCVGTCNPQQANSHQLQ